MTSDIKKLYSKIISFMKIKEFFCNECRKRDLYICSNSQKESCYMDFVSIAHESVEYGGMHEVSNK